MNLERASRIVSECDAVSLDNYLSQQHVVLHTYVEEETPKKGCFGWIRCCIPKRFKRWWKRPSQRLTTATNGQTDRAEAVVKGSNGMNNCVQENTCSTTTSRWTGFTSPVIVGVVWKNKCASIEGKKQVAGVGLPLTECASAVVTEESKETLDAGTTNNKTKKRRRNRKRKNCKCEKVTLKFVTAEEETIAEAEKTIAEAEKTIAEAEKAIAAEEATIAEAEATIAAEEATIAKAEATIAAEEATIAEAEATIAEAEATIATEEATFAEAEATIAEAEETIAEEEITIAALEETIAEEKETIAVLEKTIAEEEEIIAEEKETIAVLEETIAEEEITIATLEETIAEEEEIIAKEEATIAAELSTVTAEAPSVTAEASPVTAEAPPVTAEVSTITAEAEDSSVIKIKSETHDKGTKQIKETKKRRRRHRRKNKKCEEVTLKPVIAEEMHLAEEVTSITVEDPSIIEHIKSSTEALPSISQEITSTNEEVMPVSEEVLCAIASRNVASTEEEAEAPSSHDTGTAAIVNPCPPDEAEGSSSRDTGTVCQDGTDLHEVDQDTLEAFLKEAGLTSLSFSPLPLRRLSSSDRKDILGQRWLSDDVIDLAQEVLQRQFPHIGGLYACGAAFTLPPLQPGANTLFLQVVNRSAPQSLACMADYSRALGTHWLLLSSFGAERSGQLAVYDSMYNDVSSSTAALVKQLQELYAFPPGAKVWPVQRQQDGYSCGLFALAFAFSIALGENPRFVHYNRASMPQHLVWCLEHGQVKPFPSVKVQQGYKGGKRCSRMFSSSNSSTR